MIILKLLVLLVVLWSGVRSLSLVSVDIVVVVFGVGIVSVVLGS